MGRWPERISKVRPRAFSRCALPWTLVGLWIAGCIADAAPSPPTVEQARVELGRRLFYDTRLSRNENQSCASCHIQALAFTDGRAHAIGSTGEPHPRGAPTLANVADATTLTWANPLLRRLEQQALLPLFGERPVELGLVGMEDEVLERLRAEPRYPPLFARAFPDDDDAIRFHRVTGALAAFEGTLISKHSPYDAYRAGDDAALSPAARRGEALFFSERLRCGACHSGENLSDGAFHNTGLYDVDGQGGYPDDNQGLYQLTGDPADMGAFRTATLRNVAVTAPYMHDGSLASLSSVIDSYAAGGRTQSRLKSAQLVGFTLSGPEKSDLIAFLHALTDPAFLTEPALADPW